MRINVNDRNGNNIAFCDIWKDEFGNLFLEKSNNCINIFSDFKQTEFGFEDVIDIDVSDFNG